MASGSVRYLAGDVAVKVNKNSTRDMFFDIELKPKFRVCNAQEQSRMMMLLFPLTF